MSTINGITDWRQEFNAGEKFGTCTDTLRAEAREKCGGHTDGPVLVFGYTDYGGTAMDKAIIQFAEKYFPECCAIESTAWNGQNGIIFGDLAKTMTSRPEYWYCEYVTASGESVDLETFYYEMIDGIEGESFRLFAEENYEEKDVEAVVKWLRENRGGYWHCEPNSLDFDWNDAKGLVLEEAGISFKTL